MKTLLLLFILLQMSCDLENRYPVKGEFCIPMRENPDCVKMDFRNKILTTNQITINLNMINRVQYEFDSKDIKTVIEVLSENRIRIVTLNSPTLTKEKEEIYLRIKEPRISIWKRIKDWGQKKD